MAVRTVVVLFLMGGAFAGVADAQSVTSTGPHGSPADQSGVAKEASKAGTETAATGFVANLLFDASNSSTGAFVQLVPSIGYSFGNWALKFGVPLDSIGASSTTTDATSHRGMGDLFLSVSYAIDADNLGFTTTALSTAPTGNSAVGLGTGQATWYWTNHVDHRFGWITPFVDAGVGNSLNAAMGISVRSGGTHAGRASRIITIPTEPYMTIGKLARVDAGVDLDVSSSVSFGVLAYDSVPWGNQTAISRFVQLPAPSTQSSQPGQHNQITTSRTTRGQRFFEVNAVTQGAASLVRDNGVGASVAISPTRYLDLAVSYSHSVPMKLDVVSVTVGTNLKRLWSRIAVH